MESITPPQAYHLLRLSRKKLTRQQHKTLCGQIRAGDVTGAVKGLEKIIKRNMRKETP
jgi:hypothetical protein